MVSAADFWSCWPQTYFYSLIFGAQYYQTKLLWKISSRNYDAAANQQTLMWPPVPFHRATVCHGAEGNMGLLMSLRWCCQKCWYLTQTVVFNPLALSSSKISCAEFLQALLVGKDVLKCFDVEERIRSAASEWSQQNMHSFNSAQSLKEWNVTYRETHNYYMYSSPAYTRKCVYNIS